MGSKYKMTYVRPNIYKQTSPIFNCVTCKCLAHLPIIVFIIVIVQSYIEAGFVKMTYGSPHSLVEFLHGDNFCQAHLKAGEALLAGSDSSPVVRCGMGCVSTVLTTARTL